VRYHQSLAIRPSPYRFIQHSANGLSDQWIVAATMQITLCEGIQDGWMVASRKPRRNPYWYGRNCGCGFRIWRAIQTGDCMHVPDRRIAISE
jgi:hypothetical protein